MTLTVRRRLSLALLAALAAPPAVLRRLRAVAPA
jgi:hypothetical protein